jgi:hypothetical protein
MPPKKSSEAEYKHARFNPATSEEDRRALEIIHRLEAEGYTFKQIVQDAILRADGYRPEMFAGADDKTGVILNRMEEMVEQIADEIVKRVGTTPSFAREMEDDGERSTYTKTLAKSFLQRQRSGGRTE